MLSISKVTARISTVNEAGKREYFATLEVDRWQKPEITIRRMVEDLSLLINSGENIATKARLGELISNIYYQGLPSGYANSAIIGAIKIRGGEYTVFTDDGRTLNITFDVLYRRVEIGAGETESK